MTATILIFVLSFFVAVLCWRLVVTTNALRFLGGLSEHQFSIFRIQMNRDDRTPAEALETMMAEAKLREGR